LPFLSAITGALSVYLLQALYSEYGLP
jgi:hypothetical protein